MGLFAEHFLLDKLVQSLPTETRIYIVPILLPTGNGNEFIRTLYILFIQERTDAKQCYFVDTE